MVTMTDHVTVSNGQTIDFHSELANDETPASSTACSIKLVVHGINYAPIEKDKSLNWLMLKEPEGNVTGQDNAVVPPSYILDENTSDRIWSPWGRMPRKYIKSLLGPEDKLPQLIF